MTVPVYNMVDTWNDAGTAFTAIKMNVTNTASASGSKLFDLLVAGTSKFNVKSTGEAVASGLDVSAVNPVNIGNAGEFMGVRLHTSWDDLTGLNPNFANIEGISTYFSTWHADATYTGQTQAKTTQLPLNLYFDGRAAGQRFITAEQIYGYGMGDCFVTTCRGEYGGGPLPGDEGFGYRSVGDLSQPRRLTLGTISSVTRATGNTTVTQTIVANKDPQFVTVASTVNINVGDWYQVQRQTPAPEYNTEAVKILEVGVGTVKALFRVNVPSGGTLTPALVLGLDSWTSIGQLRVLVNLSGASYSAGQITTKFGGSLAGGGGGMALTNNMVGGDAYNIGAISVDCDTFSASPFDGTGTQGPLRAWYEIKQVFPTQVDIVSMSVANDQGYRSSRWSAPTNYMIRPAVRVLRNLGNGLIVCETTTSVWTVGNSVEQAICPYPDCIGDNRGICVYTPGATLRSLFTIANNGPVPFQGGLTIAGVSAVKDTGFGFETGLAVSYADIGIAISNEGTAAIRLGAPGLGRIQWQQLVNQPYIEYNAEESLSFVYGGTATPLAGMFCTDIDGTTNLSSVEFRTSSIGISGNSSVSSEPIFRFARTPTDFAAAATSIDLRFGESSIKPGIGYNAFLVKVYGVEAFAASEWGVGTNLFMQYVPETLVLVNGPNGAKTIHKSFQRITGPTLPFSISGFNIPVTGVLDGAVLYLYNSTAQPMTLINNTGSIGDILTLTNANVVLTPPALGGCFATFIYHATDQRWILVSTHP